ncbi:hypothetical protein [Kineococcus sp. SYSU DK006]|uniref:hypothetical protein n=1 Tax=Kineococcus sp. SYSU DK006 TaxID=3383127 RepID=UPI003D7C8F0A
MEHGALAALVVLTVVVGFVRLWSDVRSELSRSDGGADGSVPRGGGTRSGRPATADPLDGGDGEGVLVVGRRAVRGPAAASGARVPRQGGPSARS